MLKYIFHDDLVMEAAVGGLPPRKRLCTATALEYARPAAAPNAPASGGTPSTIDWAGAVVPQPLLTDRPVPMIPSTDQIFPYTLSDERHQPLRPRSTAD